VFVTVIVKYFVVERLARCIDLEASQKSIHLQWVYRGVIPIAW